CIVVDAATFRLDQLALALDRLPVNGRPHHGDIVGIAVLLVTAEEVGTGQAVAQREQHAVIDARYFAKRSDGAFQRVVAGRERIARAEHRVKALITEKTLMFGRAPQRDDDTLDPFHFHFYLRA